jgi:hypothetical protein
MIQVGKPRNRKTAQKDKRQINSRYAEGGAKEEREGRRNKRKFIFYQLRIYIVHGTSFLLNCICFSPH